MNASEAWKRIRQLKAEHFTQAQIARAGGWKDRHLPIVGPCQVIQLRTLLRIRKVYRQAFEQNPPV